MNFTSSTLGIVQEKNTAQQEGNQAFGCAKTVNDN